MPHAADAEPDRIWRLRWAQKQSVLAATPTTVVEDMVILMTAAGNRDTAGNREAAHAIIDATISATARATRYLAGTAGVSVAEFGGDLYLPAGTTPSCMERAA